MCLLVYNFYCCVKYGYQNNQFVLYCILSHLNQNQQIIW